MQVYIMEETSRILRGLATRKKEKLKGRGESEKKEKRRMTRMTRRNKKKRREMWRRIWRPRIYHPEGFGGSWAFLVPRWKPNRGFEVRNPAGALRTPTPTVLSTHLVQGRNAHGNAQAKNVLTSIYHFHLHSRHLRVHLCHPLKTI